VTARPQTNHRLETRPEASHFTSREIGYTFPSSMAIMPDMSLSLPRIERDLVLDSTPDRGIKGPLDMR
jgi:hypothetical protein